MFKKTTFALLPIFLLFQALALAADVKLAWDPNTEPELKGYYVYYGTASGNYSQKKDAGNQTTYTVTGLTEGTTYYFAVTAYSDTMESDYSDEISYKAPVPVVTYTLTASAGANGAISPAGTITVNQGTSQTFTITPATNYHVADVKVDGDSIGPVSTYTFSNVGANHTIEATFAIDTYTISATAGANGSISPNGSVNVSAGTTKTFSITPATNYHVADVKVDGDSVGAVTAYTFSNITANHTIEATFAVDTYTINATAGANGAISPAGSVTINAGTSKTFSIAPANGYHIADVKVDGASIGAVSTYTFDNVSASHSISAYFEEDAPNTFTIAATAGSGGSLSPSGNVIVEENASRTFTITPATNYHIANVTVDGASKGAIDSYTFSNVTRNHSIGATFAIDTYTISASTGTNGSITPSGSITVNAGAAKTFNITPANGYHIADVKVDGTSRGAINSYTFSGIEANHSISAFFEKDAAPTYTITATAGPYGSISPSGTVTVAEGQSQTFTITPSRLYQVNDVRVDGISIGAVNSFTLTGIQANHTISASFKMGLTPCDEVTLAWNPSTDPAVRGYKVRYGTAAGSYDAIVDTGSSASCSISGLANNQQYYLKITAYTANGESDYSDEFTYKTCAYKKLPPPMLKLLGLQ